VKYVASHSNSLLPTIYLVSGVWGGHEGSLLLWATILAIWTVAVTRFSRSVPRLMVARVVGVMGMVSIGFLLFMLLTSNPFERLPFTPAEGRDLNPLLQDPGLAIHPPLLYIGYVGFSVSFAFAIAALLGGNLDSAWARWSRPWTNVAWAFLTFGIVLGSWWAYYELGWGGWWFWDPVENSSFMPWLAGTALIHSLAVTEKRGAFKAWTVLLAILAFSLCLLGTFLVRSGVLTSVHAFATDPERGVFILLFLVLVIGGSLLLYSWRVSQIRSTVKFSLISRETGLLINNVFLVVATLSVLLGTLYPLILDALGMGKISVGPPYFNNVFVPLTIPLALSVGIGALLRWKHDQLGNVARGLILHAGAAILLGLLFPLAMPYYSWGASLGMMLAFWTALSVFSWIQQRCATKGWLAGLRNISRSGWGMVLGHLGIAVFIVGVTLVTTYNLERDVRLAPGESFTLGDFTFTFRGADNLKGPNYSGHAGQVDVTRNDEWITTLQAEKRQYSTGMPMSEVGIDAGLTRDLYVALGEPIGNDGAWSLRLHYKPYVRWIWLGGLLMAFGGLLAASDKRYFRLARRSNKGFSHEEAHT
jgi:cytochrome c-type biogenesis protein CcmF